MIVMKHTPLGKLKLMWSVGIACMAFACGTLPNTTGISATEPPTLLSVEPKSESEIVVSNGSIRLRFDRPMDPGSVSEESIWMVSGTWTWDDFGSMARLERARTSAQLIAIHGSWAGEDDGRVWMFQMAPNDPAEGPYTMIITSHVLSRERRPFSAEPERGNRPLFLHYTVMVNNADNDAAPSDAGDSGVDADPNSPSNEPSRFDTLRISEIFYDCAGDESDGQTFVELSGTPNTSISGIQILIVNGANGHIDKTLVAPGDAILDADGFFVIADARTNAASESRISDADWIVNMDLQNGPDAVFLLDADASVLDKIGYGEGMVALSETGIPLFEGEPAMDVDEGESLCRETRVEGVVDRDHNASDFFACEPTPGLTNRLLSPEIEEGSEPATDEAPGDVPSDGDQPDPENQIPDDLPPSISAIPRIIISEGVTDPQRDWNDTAGGNGLLFDSIAGTGTVGTSDEWIELYNASDEEIDLRGFVLMMNDTTPTEHVFVAEDALAYFQGDSQVSQWLSGEWMIVGNPEGDLQNKITLELRDPDDTLIDRWVIEDGNATGIDNESISRRFVDGVEEIEQGEASPFE